LPARDACSDRVDDAGTVDAGDEGKHGIAPALVPGPQAHVEHAVHRRRVNPDADLARLRLRVRPVLVLEHVPGAELVDHNRLHAAPCSLWDVGGSAAGSISRPCWM